MTKFDLHLGHLNVAELIALGQEVNAAMSGDSGFAGLQSQIDCLADATDEMILRNEDYQATLQLVQERFAQRQAQRAALENLLTELAGGVEDISIGNTRLVESPGLDTLEVTGLPTPLSASEPLPTGMERAEATR